MHTRIKICGITRYEDARIAVNLGVDALGFSMSESNKRYIAPEAVLKIIQKLPPFISKVGVFDDDSFDEIVKRSQASGIDTIQLNGDYPPEFVNQFRVPIIKKLFIDTDYNPEILNKYNVSAFLVDISAKNTEGSLSDKRLKKHAIKLTYSLKKNIILSGQIGITTIRGIVEEIAPYGVNIIESVEIRPGIKNPQKMRDLIKVIKELNFKERP